MSYTGSAGSYYEFTPGQVYLDPRYNNGMYHSYHGFGQQRSYPEGRPSPLRRLAMLGRRVGIGQGAFPWLYRGKRPRRRRPQPPLMGFGALADEFKASKVWADAQLGGSCYTPSSPNYQVEEMYGACNAAGARATDMIRAALNELGYGPLVLGEMWSEANPGAALKKYHADKGLAPGPGLGVSQAGLVAMEEDLKSGKKAGVGLLGVGLVALAVGGGLVVLSKMRKRRV